jgi:hypothetical protein
MTVGRPVNVGVDRANLIVCEPGYLALARARG